MGSQVRDDREEIQADDRVLLIAADDASSASTLLDLARENGFKGVVAPSANVAFGLVKQFPPSAIALDLRLPDMDGLAVLDLLKHDPEARHIPVTVISADDHLHRCRRMGAFRTVRKPAARETLGTALAETRKLLERKTKTLLVADRSKTDRTRISEALRGDGVHITPFETGKRVLDALRRTRFDCVVLGHRLRDMTGVELLRKIVDSGAADELPLVLYGPGTLGRSEQEDLNELAETVVVRSAATIETLLEETTLFLHRAAGDLPRRATRDLLASGQRAAAHLAGRKALIIDDDIRNIFALTGVLEQKGMVVLNAEDGKKGLETLKNHPEIDVVLMDVMMPELDGYDTIRVVRGRNEFRDLPTIAVTARAMKGDREKCLEAGASDYIAKPVNVEHLLSLLRVWVPERRPTSPLRRKREIRQADLR